MPTSSVPENRAPIVCAKIVGGLGNQMFCAAAGMALARRIEGAALEFDLRQYAHQTLRAYELDLFHLPATIRRCRATPDGTLWSRLTGSKPNSHGKPPGWKFAVWKQQGFHYDPSFHALRGSVHITGYFQSAKYFDEIAPQVRRSFDLRPHLSPSGQKNIEAAHGDDTVAVHVRRNDYVSDAKTTAIHGILDAEYYRRALGFITRIVEKPRFFVVSDDENGARELLQEIPGATFVSGTTHLDDMHLISSCRHRIIANSSFSWWGAWLDSRTDGVTIAPRAWFSRTRMLKIFIDDLYPSGWLLT